MIHTRMFNVILVDSLELMYSLELVDRLELMYSL